MVSGPRPQGGVGALAPVSAELPEPFEYLTDNQRRIFADLVKRLQDMNAASATHTEALNMCAIALDEVEALTGTLQDEGTTYKTRNQMGEDVIKAHPAFAQRSEAMRRAAQLLGEMGLTAKSRANVKPSGKGRGDPQKPGNEFDGLDK